jgi:hypothetical protein
MERGPFTIELTPEEIALIDAIHFDPLAFQADEDCGPVTSGDIVPLGATVRQLARTHRLEAKVVANEFNKLCLDLSLSAGDASSIWPSVQYLRSVC